MSNMSYCRFRNTNLDVQDCMETLTGLAGLQADIYWLENTGRDEEPEMEELADVFRHNKLSTDEARAASRMIKAFLDTMEELEIIENYDLWRIDDMIENFTK